MYKQIRPNLYAKDDETWGNPIEEKQDKCTRMCMENVNNLRSSTKFNYKLDKGKKWLIKKEVDIAYWLKVGLPW